MGRLGSDGTRVYPAAEQMDVRGWRKWLRTPGSINAPQNQEAGMLKLLLGHWKAHRRKPSLLPEDGDIRFEDPSTINPLFEDSDSSISSTNKQTESVEKQRLPQIANEQDPDVNDVPAINELIDTLFVPTHSGDSVISDEDSPKDEIIDTRIKETELATETISELDNIEEDKSPNSLETKVTDQNPSSLESKNVDLAPSKLSSQTNASDNISSKGDKVNEEIKTEDKMRIYNQPSTSAIGERKNSFKNIAGEKAETRLPTSKSSNGQNTNKQANKSKTSKENKLHKLENNEISTPQNKTNSPAPIQSIDSEKPAKLRAKAIDELIKKFQNPITESDNAANSVVKSENKQSQNLPSKSEEVIKEVLKTKVKTSSSPAIDSSKNISKATKVEELPETTKPATKTIETVAVNKKDDEKESLSNIFKFPPPPPIENLENVSSLHGKILKEKKPDSPLPSTSKIKQNNTDKLKESEPGKTRSDSSLERTRTSSSNKPKEIKEKLQTDIKKDVNIKVQDNTIKETSPKPSSSKGGIIKDSPIERNEKESKESKRISEPSTESKSIKESKSSVSQLQSTEQKPEIKTKAETKIAESKYQTSNTTVPTKKQPPPSNQKSETTSKLPHKDPPKSADANLKSPIEKQKLSFAETESKPPSPNENENVKSHSEDSGITRGDQISSETTQETIVENAPAESNPVQNPARKSRKEKKSKPSHRKSCKKCKHSHSDTASIKRSQYDEYYDALTGSRHFHRGKHSDSWTSDFSLEEKELLRRLRSRRGTVRSNTPSNRSRLSKRRFIDENHFRRHHNTRRSVSDDSTFYGSSVCSCDECWAQYVRDYAYIRASLRGMPPIQPMCTCRTSRHNFLGRRVQFRSDTIPEGSPSERTTRTTTPAPPADNKQEDETDDKSSEKSSNVKDTDSVQTNPDGIKGKKSKLPEEPYRFVTPWELEEWDFLMKKQLLQRRRRRARCMGIMALAMVVFVGLIVAIVMVYLRRKVL